MASANLNAIKFVRGKLVANPTSLSTTHGGTELGLTRGRIFRPNVDKSRLTQEAHGGVTHQIWHMQKSPQFACFLRDWDAAALARFFPDTSGSVVRGSANASGGIRSGYGLASNAFKLLFLPDDSTNHPAILIYKFIPWVDPEAEIGLSLREEFGLLVGGEGTKDSAGKLYEIGLLSALTLGS